MHTQPNTLEDDTQTHEQKHKQASPSVSFLRLGVGHIIEGLQCALLLLSLAIYQATHCSHKLPSPLVHIWLGLLCKWSFTGQTDNRRREDRRRRGKRKIAICKEEARRGQTRVPNKNTKVGTSVEGMWYYDEAEREVMTYRHGSITSIQ